MNPKVWTPRYVVNRIAVIVSQRLHPDWPWLTSTAVRFLDQYLRPTDIGLEWGCGRSTIWIAKRVRSLVSIEHSKEWYDKVRQRLQREHFDNVDLRLGNLDGGPASKYVHLADEIPKGSLDFVIVDGRLRHLATKEAMELLRCGGLLILDNANYYFKCQSSAPGTARSTHDDWIEIEENLSTWRRFWTTNGVWDTALWFKPAKVTPRP